MAPAAEILSKQIICKEPGRYIGWPTIIRTRAGELIIAFSGDRDSHICPYGKTDVLVRTPQPGTDVRPSHGGPSAHFDPPLLRSATARESMVPSRG